MRAHLVRKFKQRSLVEKNVNSQQHTYLAYSRQTNFPLLALSASLRAKIVFPADVTDQTRTQFPTNLAVNQSNAEFIK